MEILTYPHPKLFQACNEVTVFGPELATLLEAMWETMIAAKGIGLAANQVGLDFRMFTMEGPKGEKLFIVNPEITNLSLEPVTIKEGCLSAPGEFVVLLERVKWVQVHYQNEKGEKKLGIFFDIHSVCVQHEIGHLDGKSHLESKYIPKQKRFALAKKWGFKVK